MQHWSSRFIGLPHAPLGADRSGVNCWTLIVLIYRQRFGVTLPTYLDRFVSLEETEEIAALMSGEAASAPWSKVTDAAEGDVALFRRGSMAAHVGLIIRPGLMLHVAAEDCSKIERYDCGPWRNRLVAIMRHDALRQVAA